MIRAIETEYRGYRFRSRLEARWAVCFDALDIEWQYEPEGYELSMRSWPSGSDFRAKPVVTTSRYLPDFWLPAVGIFVEVKGGDPTQEERNLCEALQDQSGRPVLLVNGMPFDRPATLWCWDITDSSAGNWSGLASVVFPDGRPLQIVAHTDDRCDRDRELCLDPEFSVRPAVVYAPLPYDHPQTYASDAAKSARFEYGQKGAS